MSPRPIGRVEPEKNSHCSWCGQRFADGQPWPRTCAACARTTFLNPLPVAVLLVPVDGGLLVIRRGIEPGRGRLALPGGYMGVGESWEEAAARELLEETGVRVAAGEIGPFRTVSTPDGTMLLVFGLVRGGARAERDLPPFEPGDEATERGVIRAPEELAFSLHTEVVRDWFATRRGG